MSSVVKKIITALTGLALVGFAITHLLGNLTLLAPGSAPFNAYAANLESFGLLLEAAEVILFTLFVVHAVNGILLKLNHKAARPVGYRNFQTKGSPSRANLSSMTMIFSGFFLLAFLVLHIWQFKFGPSLAQGYVTEIKGQKVRDLHRLVVETFKNPLWVSIYVAAMLFLGMHLRHGFWSAFQSIGIMKPSLSKPFYILSLMIATALAVGFLMIPVLIYMGVSGVSVVSGVFGNLGGAV